MKIQIDLKSALCGLVAGIGVMLCAGGSISTQPVGKFQIAAAAAPNGSHFAVVDTQTGEVWGVDSTRNWNYDRWQDFWKPK